MRLYAAKQRLIVEKLRYDELSIQYLTQTQGEIEMTAEDILKELEKARQLAKNYNYGQEEQRLEELKKLIDKIGKTTV
jgi:hypothetical protein